MLDFSLVGQRVITLPQESFGDLTNCENEPIHIPGTIQPLGFLLASPSVDVPITHASENAQTLLGSGALSVLGQTWLAALGPLVERALKEATLAACSFVRPSSIAATWSPYDGGTVFELIVHVRGGLIILEAEEVISDGDRHAIDIRHELTPLLGRMAEAISSDHLHSIVAEETRRITQFDRVLIYQFDEKWNGTVIAESRNESLPAYMGHRFPAADIPRQARELYHINRLRLIANSDYTAVPVLASSKDARPLDLSLATLRGISPIHLEYMRNMGTGSSMSASIMREGKLWGLLSCHGREPRRLSFSTRAVCDLVGQIFSLQLATREQARQLAHQVELRKVLTRLLTRLNAGHGITSATEGEDLLALTGASGVALVKGTAVTVFGITPPAKLIPALCAWVAPLCADGFFKTNALSASYPEIGPHAPTTEGLLALSISPTEQSYVLWFRAELVETVMWGGDPHKAAGPVDASLRIYPRKSFETWKETVRGRSIPWDRTEEEVALGLRLAIVDIAFRKAAEMAPLVEELKRVNKEMEAFAYTVSHDLRAPFRHVGGYATLLKTGNSDQLDEDGRYLLEKIMKAAATAGKLVDTMLAFSRMSLAPLSKRKVGLAELVERSRQHAMASVGEERAIRWIIPVLPEVMADAELLQLAVQNLFDNAVKYTGRREQAVIELGFSETADEWIISVKDNGTGFNMRFADKLFGVFQRLHAPDEFPGTGIGLASVRRIIERHGGTTRAVGEPGVGAVFYFTLPRPSSTITPLGHD